MRSRDDLIKEMVSASERVSEIALAILNTPEAKGFRPPNPYRVVRYFEDTNTQFSYSSWFPLWGGWVGAAHSDEGLVAEMPNFASGPEVKRLEGMDFVLYGCTKPSVRPTEPDVNDRITQYGYPAGSKFVASRTGEYYMPRPKDSRNGDGLSHIFSHDKHQEPSVGGMSGGPNVLDRLDEVIGITVTQNGKADLDMDGYKTHSSDIVLLCDIWDAWNG